MPEDIKKDIAEEAELSENETPAEDEAAAENKAASADKSLSEIKAEKKARKKLIAERKKEGKRLKKEYEARKKRILQNEETAVCPPDRGSGDSKKQLLGYIARCAVIFFAVFAMGYFVSDAFGFTNIENQAVSTAFVFLWSFLFTAIFSASALVKPKWLAHLGGTILTLAAVVLMLLPDPVMKPYEAVLTAFNAARDHMASLGYYALNQHPVEVSQTTGSQTELIRTAVFLFILFISALYVLCLMHRIKLWKLLTAGLVSAAIIFVIFEYNITRSNWGVTLLICSFAAALVMAAYDSIYMKKQKKATDGADVPLFEEENAPAYPAILARRADAKLARAERKKLSKKVKKSQKAEAPQITVEEEINDYFADKPAKKAKKAKTKKPKLTSAEKKAEKLRIKEEKRQKLEKKRAEAAELKAYRSFLRAKSDAGVSMGGFAGLGMFLLAIILLILPTLTVSGPFKTVEAVDKKFEFYREYVTALLMGDDPALDLLAYQNNESNFEERDTSPKSLYYEGTTLFTVEQNSRYNVYLRGWVATAYNDETGSWTTENTESETFTNYRGLFQTYIDPSENSMYNFWRIMEEGSIPDESEKDYTSSIKSNTTLGFVVSQVNVKREELKTTTLYMPAFNIRQFMPVLKNSNGGSTAYLRAYGSDKLSEYSYADFFDGIYSSYRASMNHDGYASVSMITTMKTSSFYITMAKDIAELQNARAAIESGKTVVSSSAYGDYECTLTLTDGTLVTYRVEERPAEGESFTYVKDADGNEKRLGDGYTYIIIPQEVGDAVYQFDNSGTLVSKNMENIPEDKLLDEEGEENIYRAPSLPFIVRYFEIMTDEERGEVGGYLRILDFYTDYVNRTYTQASSSQVIKDFTQQFIDQAETETYEPYEETDEETGEVYEMTRKITVHADYSAASEKTLFNRVYNKDETAYEVSLYSAVTDYTVYKTRHELVMAIIDYLADENNFTYTLYPTVSEDESLVGVEKFISDTHEGSCVQYATTLVLMLRELGIPARYVEGYIASGFTANRSEDKVGSYISTVRDSDAHAWVEVWYDGVGWVQYEATPKYYNAMYETRSDDSDIGHIGGGDSDDSEEEEEDSGLTDEEIAELERQRLEAERKALIKKIVTISLIVLAFAAAIAIFFLYFWQRARKAQKKRNALLSKLANAEESAPTREEFRQLIDMTRLMLKVCGLSPVTGEFREEYAARLAKKCAGALAASTKEEGLTELQRSQTVLTEARLVRMLDGVAAEEFGYGTGAEAMVLLARFYRRIYAFEYRHVNIATRVWLWLFANKL